MGGKRPDQYRIDRNEGRTSDHKRLPDEPREGQVDDQIFSNAKGELEEDQPIPPLVLDPETERLREKELDREERKHTK
jgi:hypothetical protein